MIKINFNNIKFGGLFSIHLFIITIYILLFFNIENSAFLFWQVLGLFINLLLGIILMKAMLNKITVYYSILLCFIVYIFTFLGSPIIILYHFSFSIVSFLPALVLHFLVLFFYGEHTKTTKIFLGLQLLLSFIRNTLAYSSEPFMQFNIYIFFLSIITFYLFSTYLYFKGPRKKSTVTISQKKQLFIGTLVSFLPFILFSIVPAVVTLEGSLQNYWTLVFFLVLPLVVANILTEENLVYQQYWKTSLIQDFILISLFLLTLVTSIGYLFSFSFLEMIILGNFLLFFFFTFFLILQIYNKRNKVKIIDQLLAFPMEKQFLTQELLSNQYIKSIQSLLFTSLSHKVNLIDLDIIHKDKLSDAYIKNSFYLSSNDLKDTKNALNKMKESNEESTSLILSGFYYLILNIDNYNCFLLIKKDEEFINDEIQILKEFQPVIEQLFISTEKLSTSIFDQKKTHYTDFEKSIFLKEVDLAEKYQSFIAHYLHDEVLQSILSIRQSVYQKDNPQAIRDSIEHVVAEIESSIRKKMIEWESSRIPEQSLKESVGELTQKLVIMYDKVLFVKIDIPDSLGLPTSFQQFLFRSIRELLINAYKHSDASIIKVSLKLTSTKINLFVEDNGSGTKNSIDFQNEKTHNFGLYSIYQHTHAFDGSMSLFKNDEAGLSVHLSFPLEMIMKGLN